MRNAVLPLVSSEIYNFGSNEVQMPNLNISMDSKVSAYGSSFCLGSRAIDDGNQLRSGEFVIPYQHYQSGNYQFTSSNRDNNAQQSIHPQQLATTMRKRSIDVISQLHQGGITNLTENTTFSDWKSNKRRKATSFEEQWLHQVQKSSNVKEQKVTVTRSQKLSDKITALQKLVSPYGKTDTASVLQEASLYIKLLQQQIQNLFQMLSSSCPSQKIDGEMLDLQSKGLCLFPTSVMQKLSQEHGFATCNAYSSLFI
ncbi:transcription factor bHLH133 isoform X2 [Ricinus communis]|uniref:transcription factor bHLH133 isoform X2 n=1 Tax=Ricinus communis TaxID=3988 RepID=UPI0007726F45|nr:transcription factor bHLH133 isoform X2 [Ricinus communis]|eukprot:XP_015580402.1 transcription factor bHLH133 isoform X2 [Ricinus communis]